MDVAENAAVPSWYNPLVKWEVVLEDERDCLHTFRVWARTRDGAIVGGYDEALIQHYHNANSWALIAVAKTGES